VQIRSSSVEELDDRNVEVNEFTRSDRSNSNLRLCGIETLSRAPPALSANESIPGRG
jgi:hypothetical protein